MYVAILFTTIVNTIIPLSGSAVVTPLLVLLVEPHKAISLAIFFFLLSAIIRLGFFKRDVLFEEVKKLLPLALVTAPIGSLVVVFINSTLLVFLVFLTALYFLLKKLRVLKMNKGLFGGYFTGAFSGFLQGAGLGGSDIRNAYLYSKDLTINQVHGTTALIAIPIFAVATLTRLLTNQVTVSDLLPILYFLPVLFVGVWFGKKALVKLPQKITNILIVVIMFVIVTLLALDLAERIMIT